MADAPEVPNLDQRVLQALEVLCKAVYEMSCVGMQPIPDKPDRVNLLAQPYQDECRICSLPGHKSVNVDNATFCRIAIISLIGFWEDIETEISFLLKTSSDFKTAIRNNQISYEMRFDNSPPKGQKYEEIVADRLARNYLKFQGHCARIRAKAQVILTEEDVARYEAVTVALNNDLLQGQTLSDLFERWTPQVE